MRRGGVLATALVNAVPRALASGPMSKQAGVESFWSWWSSARGRVERCIETGEWGDVPDAITDRVKQIDERLSWELCAGAEAKHALCVTAEGDPEARIVAERWLAAAPEPDATWEFHTSRQPRLDRDDPGTIEIAGTELDLGAIALELDVDETREVVHVRAFHPRFASLPESVAGQVVFITLDGLLGEDGVERFVGAIDVAEGAPDEPASLADFVAAVEKLAAESTGERYAVMEGETEEGLPAFVTANLALKRVDYPTFAMHGEILIVLHEPTEAGLTTKAEADALDAIEDDLLESLEQHAVFAGRETVNGTRVIHVFAPDESAAPSIVAAWRSRHTDYEVKERWTRDPTWSGLPWT